MDVSSFNSYVLGSILGIYFAMAPSLLNDLVPHSVRKGVSDFILLKWLCSKKGRRMQKVQHVRKHYWEESLGMHFSSEEKQGLRNQDSLRSEWEDKVKLVRRTGEEHERTAEEGRRQSEKVEFERAC